MQNCKTRYKTTVDLNEENSPYTGTITCYDGEIIYDDGNRFNNSLLKQQIVMEKFEFIEVIVKMNQII